MDPGALDAQSLAARRIAREQLAQMLRTYRTIVALERPPGRIEGYDHSVFFHRSSPF
jgi:hypothetical protein